MSKATKKKFVVKEVLGNYDMPEPHQKIVKVMKSIGNNLHEVIDSESNIFIVSMPTKFRKNIWIIRGNYLLVEPIIEGNKVKAEIVAILFKDQIKNIKKSGFWPHGFIENEINGENNENEEKNQNDEN
ncbi:unnamed protein product [Gordionus sp. m RMFG-2023]|uniref:probable RNA-binding protein EIF1AD n=1 Tax=Gordionus sp. m RMFG-2023 TaxID=3053472 RepID=UPI0030DF649D